MDFVRERYAVKCHRKFDEIPSRYVQYAASGFIPECAKSHVVRCARVTYQYPRMSLHAHSLCFMENPKRRCVPLAIVAVLGCMRYASSHTKHWRAEQQERHLRQRRRRAPAGCRKLGKWLVDCVARVAVRLDRTLCLTNTVMDDTVNFLFAATETY